MSAAIVCGKRKSSNDEISLTSPYFSSSVSKRLRCSNSTSPAIQFYPSYNSVAGSAALGHLISIFPGMDKEFLETLLECGDDLDSAIKSMTQLRLGSTSETTINLPSQEQPNPGDAAAASSSLPRDYHPKNRPEWVELFVREMTSPSTMDDAKARAPRLLEAFEKFIRSQQSDTVIGESTVNNPSSQQLETVTAENTVLKRAVSIQHERQKEFDGITQQLKQLLDNYALTMHLRQATQNNNSIISRPFGPDVF
ncbi:hypothetical protein MKW98_009678 [Papaver atlanticum]|uniref:CUE domain-containing protein n=1 Tax=Papaver atlanticum TaxID=357466 RepID=A0AAD4XAT5_9MAGN|nr:hypothetical protein MKW98_009678 [Papaver atlanticum]